MRFLPFIALGCVALGGAAIYNSKRPVQRQLLAAPAPASGSPAKAVVEAREAEPQIRRVKILNPRIRKVVDAAKAQVGDVYNASYQRISYPNGDVPKGTGACTDVIVRAFRGANIDLQSLIHKDMRANFRVYPNNWKLGRTDKNIDHRRVPNHIAFFKRFGKELPIGIKGADLKTWLPGDVVEWKFDNGLWHTGIISDGIGPRGLPLVVHNGWECVEQDALDTWEIKAHFRYLKS